VLLLEAGQANENIADRIAAERIYFWVFGAHLDHGYKTIPQRHLSGREIRYCRGKGLGGSTLTNIGAWDYGVKEEFNEWAKVVGDDIWKWEHTLERIKRVYSLPAWPKILCTNMVCRLKITITTRQQNLKNTSSLAQILMEIMG
jgi:choline dehydrogenase-like flavoprotein